MSTTGLLTVAEVAQRMRVSCSAVYALISQDLIPVYRCGPGHRLIRVAAEDVEDVLEQCRLGAQGRFRRTVIKHLAEACAQ